MQCGQISPTTSGIFRAISSRYASRPPYRFELKTRYLDLRCSSLAGFPTNTTSSITTRRQMWVPETLAKGLRSCRCIFWRYVRRAVSCEILIFGGISHEHHIVHHHQAANVGAGNLGE